MDEQSILQQWQEATRKTIQVQVGDSTLPIVYEVVDVMSLLMDGDASNPILQALQGSMLGGQGKGVDMSNPAMLGKVVEAVDKAAIKAIVEPPLIEAGHEGGISVSRIPFAVKMEIFSDLTGIAGGEVQTLTTFRAGSAAGVPAGSKSQTVRAKSR